MSNCGCNKPVDNISEFIQQGGNGVLNTLTVAGGQPGQTLHAVNSASLLEFRAKYSDRMIEVLPGVNNFSNALVQALALSPTAINPVGLVLYNGYYSETGSTTIDIPSFVSVFPLNTALYYTILSLDNASFPPATPFIEMHASSSLENMTIVGNNNCDSLLLASGNAFSGIQFNGMVLMGGDICLTIGVDTLFFCGDNVVQTSNFNGIGQTSSVLIDILTGAQFFFTTSNASNFLFSPNVTSYRVNGSARFEGIVATSNFCENGLICNGTSTSRLLNTEIIAFPSGTATAVTVNDSAEFDAIGCVFRGGWQTHINSTALTTTVNVQSTQLDTDKLSLFPGSNVNLQYYDSQPNNLGNIIVGNQLTGTKGSNTVSVFGEGSISLQNFSVQKFDDAGAIYTDVSTTVKPAANTPVVVFDNLTIDEIFYVGDFNKFSGLSYEVTTASILGAGSTIWEFWDGLAWSEFTVMISHYDAPYQSYTNIFASIIQLQNIRFQNTILLSTNWATTAVDGITKYWVRYRITGAITQSASIKNVRLLGDQTKINSDGVTELFGRCRARKVLSFDQNLIKSLSGSPVPDQDIFIAPTIGVGRSNNQFRSAGNDSVSLVFYLPSEVDTSGSVELLLTWFTDGTDLDPIDVQIDYACTGALDEPLYLTAGAAVNPSKFIVVNSTITPNIITTSRQVSSRIPLKVDRCRSRNETGDTEDIISLRFKRNAGLNTDNLIVLNTSLIYLSCFSGYINI